MLVLMNPGSIWQQLSNVFFLSSGVVNDLLVIRMFLTFAYIFLFISGALGLPSWQESFTKTGRIAVDVMVWGTLNILLHGSQVFLMFRDEKRVDLTDEDDALWRYIYRHSGLSRAQFQHQIKPHLQMMHFEPGQLIPTKDWFYIIYQGIVSADVAHVTSGVNHSIRIYSGEMFPLEAMYVDYMPQENVFMKSWIKPQAATKVILYAIPAKQIKSLSVDPDARDAWMAMLISSLAEIAERPFKRQSMLSKELMADDDSVHKNELFDPLDPKEEPKHLIAGSNYALKTPLRHFTYYIKRSFFLPWPLGEWPVGIRHHMFPPHDPKTPGLLNRLSNWESDGRLSTFSAIRLSTQSEKLSDMPEVEMTTRNGGPSIPMGGDHEKVSAHFSGV